MIKGTVKFFNNAKGFGFITPDDGSKDVFVPAASTSGFGSGRLKAGQRVSFEAEPDPKGPKAVNLKLLDEAPREVPPREAPKEASREAPREASRDAKAQRQPLALYHDAAAEESAEIVEALNHAGHEPLLVDVALAPPGREELRRLSILLREADQSLVRRYDPLFLELQLDDRFISESEFWQAIVEHPRLINAPVLASANKARIVRSANDVKSFLGQDVPQQAKPKGLSPRMAALMKGHALPPKVETRVEKIEPAPKPVAKPEPQIKIPLKPPIKLPAKPAPDVKAKKAVAEKKPVKTVAKKIPAAKPVKKAVKKTAKKK